MTKPIFRIDENLSVQQAAEKMAAKHVGSLLVTRNEKDVGIITVGDIVSKIVAKKGDIHVKVKDVMSKPLVTVDEDTTGEDAVRTMVKNRVRKLLITNKEEIVGIFTTSDITKLAR
jgi:CBS domain-containing protein